MADETTTLPSPAPAASPDNPWAGVGPLPQGPLQDAHPLMYGLSFILGGPAGLNNLLAAKRTYEQQAAQQQAATIVNGVADRYIANNDHAGFLAAMQHPAARPFLSMLDPTSAAALRTRMDQASDKLAMGAETRALGAVPGLIAAGVPAVPARFSGPSASAETDPEAYLAQNRPLIPGQPARDMTLPERALLFSLATRNPQLAESFTKQYAPQTITLGPHTLQYDPATNRYALVGTTTKTEFQGGVPATITESIAAPGQIGQPQVKYGEPAPMTLKPETIEPPTREALAVQGINIPELLTRYNKNDPAAVEQIRDATRLGRDLSAGQLTGQPAQVAKANGYPLNLGLMDPAQAKTVIAGTRSEEMKTAYQQAFQSTTGQQAALDARPLATSPLQNGEVAYSKSSARPIPGNVTRGAAITSPDTVLLSRQDATSLELLQSTVANLRAFRAALPQFTGKSLTDAATTWGKRTLGYDNPSQTLAAMGLVEMEAVKGLAGGRIMKAELDRLATNRVNMHDDLALAQRKVDLQLQILNSVADRYLQRPENLLTNGQGQTFTPPAWMR